MKIGRDATGAVALQLAQRIDEAQLRNTARRQPQRPHNFMVRDPMRWLAMIVVAGCWSSSEPKQAQPSPVGDATCPTRGAPPAGRCRVNTDCKGEWMECAAKPAGPSLRVTGIGDSYGTDGVRCDRTHPVCPAGQVAHYGQAPNLCPTETCGPKCTPASCAADETCDGERCWPASCTTGFACAADEVCKRDLWTDKHGCTKRCPDFGYCVKYGPPVG